MDFDNIEDMTDEQLINRMKILLSRETAFVKLEDIDSLLLKLAIELNKRDVIDDKNIV